MFKKGVSFMFAALLSAILVLIVLFVLGSIFNVGVSRIFSKLMSIKDSAELQARGDSCQNLIEGRLCKVSSCGTGYEQVSGTWSDCPPKEDEGKSWFCCERNSVSAD